MASERLVTVSVTVLERDPPGQMQASITYQEGSPEHRKKALGAATGQQSRAIQDLLVGALKFHVIQIKEETQ